MIKDLSEGQTHYENDGCGEPAHNSHQKTSVSYTTAENNPSYAYKVKKRIPIFIIIILGFIIVLLLLSI